MKKKYFTGDQKGGRGTMLPPPATTPTLRAIVDHRLESMQTIKHSKIFFVTFMQYQEIKKSKYLYYRWSDKF